jgi:dTDP-4-dehydrorhamnose reductase
MKDKILLLGTTGLVGTAFEFCLNYRGDNYLALSHKEANVAYPYPELEKAFALYDPTVVINCTGVVGVNPCYFDPVRAKEVNLEGPKNLVRLCSKYKSILVQISTHNVFDGKKNEFLFIPSKDTIPVSS